MEDRDTGTHSSQREMRARNTSYTIRRAQFPGICTSTRPMGPGSGATHPAYNRFATYVASRPTLGEFQNESGSIPRCAWRETESLKL